MKTSRIATTFATTAAALAFVASVAQAQLAGVVTAVTPSAITVAGAKYDVEESTMIEDLARNPIMLREVRVGTAVELEMDEEGKLAIIRAAVVR